jgi:hypothetical protein
MALGTRNTIEKGTGMSSDDPLVHGVERSTDTQSAHVVTPRIIRAVRATKPWVTFLSELLQFVGLLGFIPASFLTLAIVGHLFGIGGSDFDAGFLATVAATWLFSALSMVLGFLLWRYAKYSGTFARNEDAQNLVAAMRAQRNLWRFMAIATVLAMAVGFGCAVRGLLYR